MSPDGAPSAAEGRCRFELLDLLRDRPAGGRAAGGCLPCAIEERWLRAWLEGLLYDKVTDRGLRARLKGSGGFCPRHARLLTGFHDGLGVAILYGDQLQEAGRRLESAASRRRAGAVPERGRCPACLAQERRRAHLALEVAAGLESLPTADLAALFEPSSRLCLPHLLEIVPRIGPAPLRRETARLAAAAVSRLQGELDEYRRKSDHRAAGEPAGTERDSWLRAVRLMTGEEGVFG